MSAIRRIRSLVEKMGPRPQGPFDVKKAKAPKLDADELAGLVSMDPRKGYDVREVIGRIVGRHIVRDIIDDVVNGWDVLLAAQIGEFLAQR